MTTWPGWAGWLWTVLCGLRSFRFLGLRRLLVAVYALIIQLFIICVNHWLINFMLYLYNMFPIGCRSRIWTWDAPGLWDRSGGHPTCVIIYPSANYMTNKHICQHYWDSLLMVSSIRRKKQKLAHRAGFEPTLETRPFGSGWRTSLHYTYGAELQILAGSRTLVSNSKESAFSAI